VAINPESPTKKVKSGNGYVKEYWGKAQTEPGTGSVTTMEGKYNLKFEEGVDSYVPYAGKLRDNLEITLSK